MLLPDNLICIDYNVRAHDEILFTPVKSEARCISRKREFNSHISHTFMNASPSSSGASRKTPLAVLTGRRGGRQDNGKRGVYSLGEQLYLGTYQRPLFMSSPQPSSTRPYTGRCVFLFLTLSFSSLSPFSRPSLPPRGSLRALSDGSVLLRSTYINGRPKGRSMERRGWQVELRTRWYERFKWQCRGYKNLRKAVPLIQGDSERLCHSCWIRYNNLLFISRLKSDLSRWNWSRSENWDCLSPL